MNNLQRWLELQSKLNLLGPRLQFDMVDQDEWNSKPNLIWIWHLLHEIAVHGFWSSVIIFDDIIFAFNNVDDVDDEDKD